MSEEDVTLAVFVALPIALGVAARAFFRRLRARGPAARPPRRTLVLGNLLVLGLLLSVAMLGGECWFRFVHDSTDALGLTRAGVRWFERHFTMNAAGFRDDVEYQLGRVPPGMRRVTFVGDSFTAGHGIADVRDRFANRVRAARPAWEVHVIATTGWETGQEADVLARTLLEHTGGAYAYDEVVLVYVLNDLADLLPGIDEFGRDMVAARERGRLARSSWLFDMIRFLWIASRDERVRHYFPMVASAYAGPVWERQKDRLRGLRESVVRRGGRLAVVTFPMMDRLGADYPFRDAHAALDAFWRAEGVPHVDLLATFEAHAGERLVVGRFDAHPNEAAHRIAAEAMLPFVDGEMARGR